MIPPRSWSAGGVTSATNGLRNLEALRAGLRARGYIDVRTSLSRLVGPTGRSNNFPDWLQNCCVFPSISSCTAGGKRPERLRERPTASQSSLRTWHFPIRSVLSRATHAPAAILRGTFIDPEYGKRLELLKEIYPRLARVALVYNVGNPGSVAAFQETQRWATTLGITLERQKPAPRRFRAHLRGDR